MHPYQMQRLLRDRHKDEILALKKGSLYHAIGRLERADLIEVETTGREGKRPERTTYRITAAGAEALTETLRRKVSEPRREPSEFMAAMSFLVFLTPEEAAERLRERAGKLRQEIEALASGVAAVSERVDRIHLVESEYLAAMQRAELAWVEALEADIRAGSLNWDLEAIFGDVRSVREQAGRE